MKKLSILLLIIICSCHDYEYTEDAIVTKAGNTNVTITGEANPFVGESYYTYTLKYPKLSSATKIHFHGTKTPMFRLSNGRYAQMHSVTLPKDSETSTVDVLWTTESNLASLTISPDQNSSIKLSGSFGVQAKKQKVEINGPASINLGETIELRAPYRYIDNAHTPKWSYPEAYMSLVSKEQTSAEYRIRLKVNKPFETASINLNIEETIIESLGSPFIYTVRNGTKTYENVGPTIQTDAETLQQYSPATFRVTDANNLSNITWETSNNIAYVGSRNNSTASIIPLGLGSTWIEVSYNYKNSSERFKSRTTFNVNKSNVRISGLDYLCSGDREARYKVLELPAGATISNWQNISGTPNISFNPNTPNANELTIQKTGTSTGDLTLGAEMTLADNYTKINLTPLTIKAIPLFNYIYAVVTYANGTRRTFEQYMPIPLNQEVLVKIESAPAGYALKLVSTWVSSDINWDYDVSTKYLRMKIKGTIGPNFIFAFDHPCFTNTQMIFRAGTVPQ